MEEQVVRSRFWHTQRRGDDGVTQWGDPHGDAEADLLARVPTGLAAALPAVSPAVLFVAVVQVRAGRSNGT
ncbi:MAG: hypothetical protein BGP03_27090 [Pseudonocardia sp. 73-21]|jgi:hypothetical protein|nr:MAG: hypothetical protein BGP03_27090 [Pseudonocardia sp. 73-21]